MSDNNDFLQLSKTQALRSYILTQMMKGAGVSAVLVFGTMILIYVIYLFGLLLPEESRQTPDPMPRSSIEFLIEPGNPTV